MVDVNDDTKAGFRRIEVLTGPGRRRRWSAEEKARIVTESLAPGVRVSEVARRWQVCPQQVFGWRREARQATTAEPTGRVALGFVPIVTETVPPVTAPSATSTAPGIEVRLAGAVVRVVAGMDDVAQLTAVLRAVRASVSSG